MLIKFNTQMQGCILIRISYFKAFWKVFKIRRRRKREGKKEKVKERVKGKREKGKKGR